MTIERGPVHEQISICQLKPSFSSFPSQASGYVLHLYLDRFGVFKKRRFFVVVVWESAICTGTEPGILFLYAYEYIRVTSIDYGSYLITLCVLRSLSVHSRRQLGTGKRVLILLTIAFGELQTYCVLLYSTILISNSAALRNCLG